MAYGLRLDQVVGAPVWTGSERYDVKAKAEHPIEPGDWQPKLEALLVDRFHLQSHWETRDRKLREAGPCTPFVPGTPLPSGRISPAPAAAATHPEARWLPGFIHEELSAADCRLLLEIDVADKTGLEGKYDIDLEWAPGSPAGASGASPFPSAEPERPPLFTALQE